MATLTDARTIRSPQQALQVFAQQPSVRVLALQLVVLIRVRMQLLADAGLASLSWWDLAIVVGIFGLLWPVQEWVLHKYLLHLRPFELLGRRIDPFFAKKHRDHHARPDHIPDIFLPLRVIVPLIPVTVGFWWLLMPTPALAMTAMIAYGGAALLYEWIHYLTHTSVAPKTRWFRRVRRNHRYHHYKNERYWYAFVLPQVDSLFGTDPKPQEVETSATARDLGVEPK